MSEKGNPFQATGRRCKVMVLSGQAIFGYLKGMDGRAAFRLYGMPADCHCVGLSVSEKAPGCVALLLESSEWEELPDGGVIPEAKFEVLTALLPPGMRVEKPASMRDGARSSKPAILENAK